MSPPPLRLRVKLEFFTKMIDWLSRSRYCTKFSKRIFCSRLSLNTNRPIYMLNENLAWLSFKKYKNRWSNTCFLTFWTFEIRKYTQNHDKRKYSTVFDPLGKDINVTIGSLTYYISTTTQTHQILVEPNDFEKHWIYESK